MNLFFNKIKEIFLNFLKFIYKEECCICKNSDASNSLCKNCLKSVSFLGGFPHKVINGVKIYSVFIYEDIPKLILLNYKFKNRFDLNNVISDFLYDYFIKNINKNFLVVPTPSFKDRISKRGFNHIEEIVKLFCEKSNLKYRNDILLKIKPTKPHYNLNKIQRFKNIKDIFSVNKNNYNGENILIIDDLITTGATLEEIINEFNKENIKNITVLTFCKTFN